MPRLLAFFCLSLWAQQQKTLTPVVPGLPPIVTAKLTTQEKRYILETVCPQGHAVKQEKSGEVYRCTSCPAESSPALDDDTAILSHVLEGHFTAAGVQERLAVFSGCGAEQRPGFTVLFHKDGRQWTKLWLDLEVLDSCHIYTRPSGRDLLFCDRPLRFRGFTFENMYQLELDRSGVKDLGPLFDLLDSPDGGCKGHCNVATKVKQQAKLVDLDGDGKPDLEVVLHLSQAPGEHETNPAQCAADIDSPASTYTLQFLYRGDRFEPTSQTKDHLAMLEKIWERNSPDCH